MKVPLERQVGPPDCQFCAKLGLPRVEWGLPRAGLALPRANFGRLRTKLGCKRAFRAPTWRLSAFQAIARALKTIEKCCTVVKFRGSGSFALQALTCTHSRPIWTLLEPNCYRFACSAEAIWKLGGAWVKRKGAVRASWRLGATLGGAVAWRCGSMEI